MKNNYIPFVSIIVLNFNGKVYLKKCLSSLGEIDYPKDRYEVIMVDNGSKDNSVEFVKEKFPWVKILTLGKNLGFCGGNNKGFEKCSGEFVVFLNNDTKVDKNWLRELVKTAIKWNDVGICGSKVVFMDAPNVIQCNGGYLNMVGGGFFDCSEKQDSPFYTGCVHGASFLVKRKIFEYIGKFDEDYFMYGDEADICLRTWLSGYSVMHVPTSLVYHAYMGSSRDITEKIARKSLLHGRILLLNKNRIYHGNKNALATLIKNFDGVYLIEALILSIVYGCLQLFLILLDRDHKHRRREALKFLMFGYLWALKNFKKLWKKRLLLKRKKVREIGDLIRRNLLLSVKNTLLFLRCAGETTGW